MDNYEDNNQNQQNKEFSSVFKGLPIEPGNSSGQSSTSGQGLNNAGQKPQQTETSGLWERQSRNPYNTTESSGKNIPADQIDFDSFEKSLGLWQRLKFRLIPANDDADAKKQKIMLFLVPVLALVFIFMLRQVFFKSPQETQAFDDDVIPVVNSTETGNEIDWDIPEPMSFGLADSSSTGDSNTYQNMGVNDIDGNMHPEMLSVRGIIYSFDKPSVLIGDSIIHLNEKINGATLVEINKDYVVFEKDDERWTKKVTEELDEKSQEEMILNINNSEDTEQSELTNNQ